MGREVTQKVLWATSPSSSLCLFGGRGDLGLTSGCCCRGDNIAEAARGQEKSNNGVPMGTLAFPFGNLPPTETPDHDVKKPLNFGACATACTTWPAKTGRPPPPPPLPPSSKTLSSPKQCHLFPKSFLASCARKASSLCLSTQPFRKSTSKSRNNNT